MPVPSPEMTHQFHADLAACRTLLKGGSKSFFLASLLLPKAYCAPAMALYAFCRIADDLVDESGGGAEAVAQLHERVEALYRGTPYDHPADRAFSMVVQSHGMPRAAVDALIEGFAWDAAGRRYQTIADLHAYGARVAGTVGLMMSVVMGRRAPDILARAADLGVAMQLTNIARDVGEDARNGRLYLPLDWLKEAGIDPEAFLARPECSPALAGVIARLLGEAERLYARADAGLAVLPMGCRASMRAARLIYAAIGHEVARRGFDSVSSRAVVPLSRKLPLLLKAFLPGLKDHAALISLPALPQTLFLVQAGQRGPAYSARGEPGRVFAVLSIIDKLERLDRGLPQRALTS